MALSRGLDPGELVRRCGCGHMLVCKAGIVCPRCRRVIPDVSAIHDALVRTGRTYGPAEVRRLAPELGIRGDQFVTDGRRIFGVVG